MNDLGDSSGLKGKLYSDANKLRKFRLVRGAGDQLRPLTDSQGFRQYRVSAVGQTTLPASARQRWGLKNGGRVAVADLGYALLIVPEQGWQAIADRLLPTSSLSDVARRRAMGTSEE